MASALEQQALATFAEARALSIPTSGDEDATVQAFILRTKREKKTLVDHWEITALVHGLHKRLVAKRKIGEDALISANDCGNRAHNQYLEAERRRVVEEDRRRQEAADQQAQADRDVELARIEAEVLAREAAMDGLSERELKFVVALVEQDYGGVHAAKMAGFTDAGAAFGRLLKSPKVQAAIVAKREAIALREQQVAVAASPLIAQDVEPAQVDVPKVCGGSTRTTWTAVITNEQQLIAAVIEGGHGIPRDLLRIDQTKLNEYARALHERINRWPGCRVKKTGRFV